MSHVIPDDVISACARVYMFNSEHVQDDEISKHVCVKDIQYNLATDLHIYILIVLCVGISKAPPVLYQSYSMVYVEVHAIHHGTW